VTIPIIVGVHDFCPPRSFCSIVWVKVNQTWMIPPLFLVSQETYHMLSYHLLLWYFRTVKYMETGHRQLAKTLVKVNKWCYKLSTRLWTHACHSTTM